MESMDNEKFLVHSFGKDNMKGGVWNVRKRIHEEIAIRRSY